MGMMLLLLLNMHMIESLSLSNHSECAICFRAAPFESINETDFKNLFDLHCSHAASICYVCWHGLLYHYGNQTKCPLCRASIQLKPLKPAQIYAMNASHAEPFGHGEPFESSTRQNSLFGDEALSQTSTRPNYPFGDRQTQPGYMETVRRRFDIKNGCVWLLFDSFVDLFRLICDCMEFNDADAVFCCPCICVGGPLVILFHFAMSCTAASITCCCCCDCFHACFPNLGMRERCVEWWY